MGASATRTRSPCSASGGATCEQKVQILRQQSEDEILQQSSKVENRAPTGEGPWPFIVAKDQGIGLKVRTSGLKEGQAIGDIATHHVAWVVCQADTGFDPDGNGSSIWYQITWPKDAAPGSGFLERRMPLAELVEAIKSADDNIVRMVCLAVQTWPH